MPRLHGAVLFIALWPSATGVGAQPDSGERFFLVLYGAQSAPFRIRFTHNWATVIHTAPTPDGGVSVRADTISWMPATLRIHPLGLRREPGVNLTSEETFDWASAVNARISMLGPYEIDRNHYQRLLARKDDLDSGAISYRAVGGLTRNAPVSNCGQSFARAAPVVGRRYWQPIPEPGENGITRLAVRYVWAGDLVDSDVTHDWLLPVLDVEPASMVRRRPGEWIGRRRWAGFLSGCLR